MHLKTLLFSILLLATFFFDLVLGTSRYPIMLIVACAIVGIYESVSPYFYSSR
jgi:hypothetical protein